MVARRYAPTGWTAQFVQVQPYLASLNFERDVQGREVVTVHQVVRDLAGALLFEGDIEQRFAFENGLITLFEIVGTVEKNTFVKKPGTN